MDFRCARSKSKIDVKRPLQTTMMDMIVGKKRPFYTPPSNGRSHGTGRSEPHYRRRQQPTTSVSKCPRNGYDDAAAGFRRHSIAAAPTITTVTTNNPTMINHSTDPSC
jgi:hypothetical protein